MLGSSLLATLDQGLSMCYQRVDVGTPTIEGCMLFLQLWSWNHLPFGRSPPSEHPDMYWRGMKYATLWSGQKLSLEIGRGRYDRYLRYTRSLDPLKPSMVIWSPYEEDLSANNELHELCTRYKALWMTNVSLLSFNVVPTHLF